MRRVLIFLVFLIVLVGVSSLVFFRGEHPRFIKTTFNELPGWSDDHFIQAFQAFKESCKVNSTKPSCIAANKLNQPTESKAREFFETWFTPYLVKNNFKSQGLFTGYYLPLIYGSLKQTKHYSVPLYGVPIDLIKVDLGVFKPELSGKTILGQLKDDQKLYPYPERKVIVKGGIDNQADVLAWSNSTVDVFFAQIQGSAIVQLPEHKRLLLGYATGNGQPYTAIGKVLIENHALKKEEVSMQSIRAWLKAHPKEADDILNRNPSYVFFRILKGEEPLGAQQVPLTPKRSLAVDKHYIPLGTPVWLDTKTPDQKPFQHLLIAQDTGGAIKGVIRGDIYFGAGNNAADIAGHMNSPGCYFVLLPKN